VKHFRPGEFKCVCQHDCDLGIDHINVDSLEKLEEARRRADVPFRINSSIRCEDHNREIGGSSTSAHMVGKAFDIRAQNSHMRERIMFGLQSAGFNRIGIYDDFIHVDDDETKIPYVMWLQSND